MIELSLNEHIIMDFLELRAALNWSRLPIPSPPLRNWYRARLVIGCADGKEVKGVLRALIR